MVTAQKGLATTALSGVANRVLVDYKDALTDYRVTDMPVISMFAERFTTETGGDIDISFSKPSMKLEQLEEGATPSYQHTDLRSERINVKEWGIAVGVTRRMLEDSRFSEMELALNEARRAVDRHVTEHAIKAIFGIADTTFGTIAIAATTLESAVTSFTANPHGGFFGVLDDDGNGIDTLADTRISEYGLYSKDDLALLGPAGKGSHYFLGQDTSGGPSGATGDISMKDLTAAMELIGSKGLTADTVMISPMHYKNLLNLADFTVPFANASNDTSRGGIDYVNDVSKSGVVGQLYGLNVIMNSYIPKNRFGVFDMSVKPMAYVERRGLTVEEANPGFGITGSYMSMRYGLKIIRPEAGVIVIGD
jgi:hypothetical protein